MIRASSNTRRLIGKLFLETDIAEAVQLIEHDCADNLPFHEDADPESLERVRFAALKLSDGKIEKLVEAISLAQTDWRDLCVAAGFANDPEAHLAWVHELT